MRVLCRHGHLAFYPRNDDDVSRFTQYYGLALVQDQDFYTFEGLQNAPRNSLRVAPWLGVPATVTYEGRGPWDVMRENGFVYDIATGVVVPKALITTLAGLTKTNYYYLTQSSLLQPGARMKTGEQVLSYDADFNNNYFQLRIRSFSYE